MDLVTESHRPRERLASVGVRSLSDSELIALILGTGTSTEPISQFAQRLVDEHGGIIGLARLGLGELAAIRGLSHGKASRLIAALEFGRRSLCLPLPRGTRIGSSKDLDAALRPRFAALEVEEFHVISLDARNRILGETRVGVGSTTYCPVSPSDVFRVALRAGAVGIVVAHNHPSGDPSPSPEDIDLTIRLVRAGEVLGVRVLDHVIIGRDGTFSFLDSGMMSPS